VSARRACAVLKAPRSSYHHRSRRGAQAELRQCIREIAETRVRYGCRRLHVLLKRKGWAVNAKRSWRLYRQEGLQLRSKTPQRKVSAKLRQDRAVAGAPNEIWAMDFLSDQLLDGTRIRVLTIVDACSRISPALDMRQS
jgi:putative transposase